MSHPTLLFLDVSLSLFLFPLCDPKTYLLPFFVAQTEQLFAITLGLALGESVCALLVVVGTLFVVVRRLRHRVRIAKILTIILALLSIACAAVAVGYFTTFERSLNDDAQKQFLGLFQLPSDEVHHCIALHCCQTFLTNHNAKTSFFFSSVLLLALVLASFSVFWFCFCFLFLSFFLS